MKLGTTARTGACNGIVDTVDVGTTNTEGALVIFQGAQPANPQTAPSGSTALVRIPLANPAFGDAATGKADIPGAASAIVANSGTAQWGRFVDRDAVAPYNTGCFDVTVGPTSPGGNEINFDNVNFVAGGTATLSSFSIIQPQGS